jgi:hypothetical protein
MAKDYKSQIDRNYTSYPVGQEQDEKMEMVREACNLLGHTLNQACPDGREKSVALTKLEEVMFWANAAIARPGE